MRAVFDSTELTPGGYDPADGWITRLSIGFNQPYQVSHKCRADWLEFFARGGRSSEIRLVFVPPPAADVDAAFAALALQFVTLPGEGVLTLESGAQSVTWQNAVLASREPSSRRGIANEFPMVFLAGEPDEAITLSALRQMNAKYKINLNAAPFSITTLTGGGAGKLDGLTTADATLGTKGEVFLQISSVYQTKTFQLVTKATAAAVAGTDGSENADPTAGTLIIHPDDYDAETNDKVWLEVL